MSSSNKLTFASALASELKRYSNQAFGLMGNGNAYFIDALLELGVSYTAVRHEAATVASADAYNRVCGRLAIATATYGAGFTNTLTALAEAAQARIPLVLMVGEAPTAGPRPWDIDQVASAGALGVKTFSIGSGDGSLRRISEIVRDAVTHALGERIPVVISIAYDLPQAELSDTEPLGDPGLRLSDPESAPAEVLRSAAEALDESESLVILAGRGAWISGAADELNELVRLSGAATASSTLGRGIFEDESVHLGVTGGFGQEPAMEVIQGADTVLVVGAGLNQFTMRFGELFGENARVIRMDLAGAPAPKTSSSISYELVEGDAKANLASLVSELKVARSKNPELLAKTGERAERARALVAQARERFHPGEEKTADGRLHPGVLARRIGELLPEQKIITQDGGHFIGWANMYWPIRSPEEMLMVGTAYQTIGLGSSTVPGVAAAAPDKTVVLSTGDGGGIMGVADLESAIRTAASLIVVVWNDGAYGAEIHLYGELGLEKSPMYLPDIDFAALGTALGARGEKIRRIEDLNVLEDWVKRGAKGAIVLDCEISGGVVAPYQREIQRINGVK